MAASVENREIVRNADDPTDSETLSVHGVMIVGGTGHVGSHIARQLRAENPSIPILLAGRNVTRLDALAIELGSAHALPLDLEKPDAAQALGAALGRVQAVVAAVPDPSGLLLRTAIDRGIAYLDITRTTDDFTPLLIRSILSSPLRPIVPLGHYLAGAFTPLVVQLAKRFSTIDSVMLAANYDPEDPVGPVNKAEFDVAPIPTLIRENGRWLRTSEPRNLSLWERLPGIGYPLGSVDIVAAAAVTNARSVRFDVVIGPSISRRGGGPASMDVYVDMTGLDENGEQISRRMVAYDPAGQAHFTALGVVTVLSAIRPDTAGGLQLPETLLDDAETLDRMMKAGIEIRELDLQGS